MARGLSCRSMKTYYCIRCGHGMEDKTLVRACLNFNCSRYGLLSFISLNRKPKKSEIADWREKAI
jgi:hypothetical protein